MLVRMEMASKKYCGMSVAVAETAVAAAASPAIAVASSSLGGRAAASAAIVRKTERNELETAAPGTTKAVAQLREATLLRACPSQIH